MIEIFQCDYCPFWHLSVNGIQTMTAADKGVLERCARIFEHCRNTSYRQAIKTLMDDIGYSEDTAKDVYMDLTEHRNSGGMQ